MGFLNKIKAEADKVNQRDTAQKERKVLGGLMKIFLIPSTILAMSSFTFAQQTSNNFDEIAPGFRIATNTISFAEGECSAYIVRWAEVYPDLNKKREATYSKADRDWIDRQMTRNERITEVYIKKIPNKYLQLLKSMPKGDSEWYYGFTATLKTFDMKPPEYFNFAMATGSSCKKAKFPLFR